MTKCDIAIVGGSGFLESIPAIGLNANFSVKVLDVKPVSHDLRHMVDFERIDIRNYGKVEKGVKDSELVIHTEISKGALMPEIKIVDKKLPDICKDTNQKLIRLDTQKAKSFLR